MCFDFERIVAANILTYNLKLLLEYAALVQLRRNEPQLHRPYRIPLGTWGLMLLFSPPTILTIVLVCCLDLLTLGVGAAVVGLGLVTYLIRRLCIAAGPATHPA